MRELKGFQPRERIEADSRLALFNNTEKPVPIQQCLANQFFELYPEKHQLTAISAQLHTKHAL